MRVGGEVSYAATAVWFPEESESIPVTSEGPELPGSGLPVLRVKSLPTSPLAAPEMAVLAAEDCLKQAGHDATALRALIHTYTFHQGHDVWPVAHYLADHIGASPHTLPLAMQHQFCNGGLASLDTAAAMLLADKDATSILLTTADRFCPPAWHRWEDGRPGGFGDGATAALLVRGPAAPGSLRVLSVAHYSAPHLERSFRGEQEFTPAPMWQKSTIEATNIQSLTDMTDNAISDLLAMRDGPRRSLAQALADAGLEPDDKRIRYIALPRIDQMLMDTMYAGAFDRLRHAEPVVFGEHTGHLGSGDPVANLVELRERGMLSPGAIVVLLGVGAGWTWSTAVLQVAGS